MYQIKVFKKLSQSEKKELIAFASTLKPSEYRSAVSSIKNRKIKEAFQFYIPLTTEEERKIWDTKKNWNAVQPDIKMSKEEIVEDAGLEEENIIESDTGEAPGIEKKKAHVQ